MIYKITGEKIKYLKEKDPNLIPLFDEDMEIKFEENNDYFMNLFSTIIAQQLSIKVASVIEQRAIEFFKGEVTPEKVVLADTEALRECGLSYRKIDYIKSLASKVLSEEVHFRDIEEMSNEQVIEMLVKIKGIGKWTAEMFLMFTLGREDVFSVLDLGLRTGFKKLYHNPELTEEEMEKIALLWAPYRSIVSFYLWRYKNKKIA